MGRGELIVRSILTLRIIQFYERNIQWSSLSQWNDHITMLLNNHCFYTEHKIYWFSKASVYFFDITVERAHSTLHVRICSWLCLDFVQQCLYCTEIFIEWDFQFSIFKSHALIKQPKAGAGRVLIKWYKNYKSIF